jgi:hypothetical protein
MILKISVFIILGTKSPLEYIYFKKWNQWHGVPSNLLSLKHCSSHEIRVAACYRNVQISFEGSSFSLNVKQDWKAFSL